ncbi:MULTISPECIES: RNA polymerase-binding protein RbpA [Microbacterium]|uniref:RNA polymerase-binding protein RbpA n=1 Tax=Microbacterium TaxID=33882 RepID=UPI00217E645C|nr:MULTISPECIES: RNA polymerase-binding protein RbpA [Microbacterium]UWF76593.1 RNA polymerase-binding protein RbpA [Microbacterium neungamense]WCM54745.1 RNA polymerase-binding protein RbpA [Microbacterium sp. EF45047]
MADRSLRGIRLGAQSLQSEEGVVFMERRATTYTCPACGHDTTLMFAADAEAPPTWECRSCGSEAVLQVDGEPVKLDEGEEKAARTHWDMLLERRTRAELEELLEERLAYIRARRGAGDDPTREKIA